MDEYIIVTEEALKAQDGKKVPLTSRSGGPIIGEAIIKYNPETKSLQTQVRIDDPKTTEFLLNGHSLSIIFKEE